MSHLPTLLLIAAAGLGLFLVGAGLVIGTRNGLRIRLRRGDTSAKTRSRRA